MNPELLVSFLLEFLAKSALILGAAALINRAWLRASAAQRHLVWCAALGTVLLLPLTRLHAPRWTVPLQRVTVELSRQPRTDLPPIESVTTPAATPNPVTAALRWRWPDWQHAIVIVWSVGAGMLLAARLLGSVRLVWLRKTTHPLKDARTQRMAAEIFTELGIRRAVELRLLPAGGVPLTWGSLRPVLTLPAEALAWSDVRLAAALRHEAGHIARGDHFTRSLAHHACALYWPNPLVWLAARSLRTAQEQATDDLVLRGGTAPEEYAAQLFDVARTLAAQHRFARHAVAMASPSTLERRMLAIVDERRDRRPLSLRAVLGGMLAVTLTLGLSTAAQLQAEEKKAAAESPPGKAPKGPQIEIEAKFVEITATAKPKTKDPVLSWLFSGGPAPKGAAGALGVAGIFTPPQFAAVMKDLEVVKGVDLLSAPRVTTFSGQKATMEIGREFRYPIEYEKDGKGWKPKKFATRNTGITFGVLATAKADGTLDLELTPSLVEFLGYIDQDKGTKYPANSKPNASVTDPDAPAGVPTGHRAQPVFSERKVTTFVTVGSGQTLLLSPLGETAEGKDFPRKGPARKLAVFVTASILKEAPTAAASPARSAPGPIEITSDSLTHDTKTGAVKATGDVTIKTPEATTRAAAAEIQPKPTAAADPLASVIIPRLEFRDAKLSEAVEFLIADGRAAGGAPVNIVVLSAPTPEPIMSLTLTDIPLTDAIRYVAELAGMKIRRDATAFVLEPAPPAP